MGPLELELGIGLAHSLAIMRISMPRTQLELGIGLGPS